MTIQLYASYLVACIALAITPGSVVTLVISSTLTGGLRAGLGVMLGTAVGGLIMISILILGMGPLVLSFPALFDVLRVIGAGYLLWMGITGWRSADQASLGEASLPPRSFWLQGLLVAVSNPKTLLFFAAFLPQFVDPTADFRPQAMLLGVTFILVAMTTDSLYVLAANKARDFVKGRGAVLLKRISALCLIGLALAIAVSRLAELF